MKANIWDHRMNINSRVPIQLNYAFANKFYGPIILLSALNDACINSRPVNFPDLSLDAEKSPEHGFHDFVNKLAQLCDIERGGKTVTALAVLQYPDHIQYRFTSNNRETGELDHTQNFITTILNALGRAEKHNVQGITSNILRTSLCFTRPRVEAYVKTLKNEVTRCISAIQKENTEECKCNDLGLISVILLLSQLDRYSGSLRSCKENCSSPTIQG
jgi:hypothetical protein